MKRLVLAFFVATLTLLPMSAAAGQAKPAALQVSPYFGIDPLDGNTTVSGTDLMPDEQYKIAIGPDCGRCVDLSRMQLVQTVASKDAQVELQTDGSFHTSLGVKASYDTATAHVDAAREPLFVHLIGSTVTLRQQLYFRGVGPQPQWQADGFYWGFATSLRERISAAGGSTTLDGGAHRDENAFAFPVSKGSDEQTEFTGEVRFTAPKDKIWSLIISHPVLRRNSSTSAAIEASVSSSSGGTEQSPAVVRPARKVELATATVSSRADRQTSVSDVVLTAAGAEAMGGLMPSTSRLDDAQEIFLPPPTFVASKSDDLAPTGEKITVSGKNFDNRFDYVLAVGPHYAHNDTDLSRMMFTKQISRYGDFPVLKPDGSFTRPLVPKAVYDKGTHHFDASQTPLSIWLFVSDPGGARYTQRIPLHFTGIADPPQTFTPSIALSESTVDKGDTLSVTGKGFAPDETATLTLDDGKATTATVDATGALSSSITLPISITAGQHHVTAVGAQSQTEASATFDVKTTSTPVGPSESGEPTECALNDHTVDKGNLLWGFKHGFREYVGTDLVGGSAAGNSITASQGATITHVDEITAGGKPNPSGIPTGAWKFELTKATYTSPKNVDVQFRGTVVLDYPAHFFKITLANPRVRLHDSTGTLYLDVRLDSYPTTPGGKPYARPVRKTGVAFGSLDMNKVVPTTSDGAYQSAAMPMTLTDADAFAGYLETGAVLDPATVTLAAQCAKLPQAPDGATGPGSSGGTGIATSPLGPDLVPALNFRPGESAARDAEQGAGQNAGQRTLNSNDQAAQELAATGASGLSTLLGGGFLLITVGLVLIRRTLPKY